MKFKKIAAVAIAACLMATFAMVGCSNDKANEPQPGSETGAFELLNDGKLTVATSPDYPPFENLEGNEYVGLDMEICKYIANELGLEFTPVAIQFDGILPAIVAGGQADMAISGITVDPERAQQVDFTVSYYIDDQSILALKDGPINSENVDTALDSPDMTIAVQSGTTGAAYAKENYPQAKVTEFGSANDSFAALQAGQAQAVITNKAVGESMLKAYTDMEIVKPIATGEEYAIAISKDNPALTAAVNKALEKMKADGTLEKLINEYLG